MNVTIRVSPHWHKDMRDTALKRAYSHIESRRALAAPLTVEEIDHEIAVSDWRDRVRRFRSAFSVPHCLRRQAL